MIAKLAGYVLTAGIAALVDLSGFALLFRFTGAVVIAATVSWLVAALVNYGLTSRYVFRQSLGWRSGARFMIGASCGFAVNVCITGILSIVFGMYPPLAKLIGIAGAFMINFTINLLWVFHPRHSGATAASGAGS